MSINETTRDRAGASPAILSPAINRRTIRSILATFKSEHATLRGQFDQMDAISDLIFQHFGTKS
ncbi:MAG: hypothetical protein ABJB02_00880 [Dokdonella sp.]